jgi:hypothetical protein
MTAKNTRKARRQRRTNQTDVDPRPIFARLEREPLVVIEHGKRTQMSTLEVMVRQQFAAAMKGSPRAIRQITKWGKAYLQLPQDTIRIIVVPDEDLYGESDDDI